MIEPCLVLGTGEYIVLKHMKGWVANGYVHTMRQGQPIVYTMRTEGKGAKKGQREYLPMYRF